ncbi:MAG: helix-turn-helix domain-containing protein [Bradyrhizobium sp.]|nr:helix-turn-helix domain-containing protein [Bradyrhizobium sp.]
MTARDPMSSTEFIAAISSLGWSVRQAADELGVNERSARRWTQGTRPIPPDIERWLRAAAAWMRENPPPQRRGA